MPSNSEDDLAAIRAIGQNINRLIRKVANEEKTPPLEDQLGMTKDEIKAYLSSAPNFAKRIVTPLRNRKPNEDETLPYVTKFICDCY